MRNFGLGMLVSLVAAVPCLADCGTCDKTIVEVAVASDDFETLVAAVKAADLVKTLSGKGPFTVFAPTDDALQEVAQGYSRGARKAGKQGEADRDSDVPRGCRKGHGGRRGQAQECQDCPRPESQNPSQRWQGDG